MEGLFLSVRRTPAGQFLTIGSLGLTLGLLHWLLAPLPQRGSADIGFSSIYPERANGLSGVVWVDVRPAADFAREHIPGALNFPLQNATAEVMTDPKSSVVLYAEDGGDGRAVKAADSLSRRLGRRIFVLVGGLRGWKQSQAKR